MKLIRQLKRICASALVLACLCGEVNTVQAAGPTTLNYQGFLTDQKSGMPVNASVSVTFKLYDALIAGNLLYAETQSLTATNGVINAQIGAVTTFPVNMTFDRPYWLEVTVGNDTLLPRQALGANAFAINAARLGSPDFSTGNTYGGAAALWGNWTGTSNTAIGTEALSSSLGSNNIAIGRSSGKGLSGSNNVYLGYVGHAPFEDNTIRIGQSNNHHRLFVAGVYGVNVLHQGFQPVVIDENGQMGSAPNYSSIGTMAFSYSSLGNNISIGNSSGKGLGGNNNIYLGYINFGLSEDNTIRIGQAYNHHRLFVSGVYGVTPFKNDGQPVVVDSSGQLGNISGITLTSAGLGFGATTRQMLNLWGSYYGIGVQNNIMYARTASGFAWFQGGVHSDAWNDPGAGGRRLMGLSEQGLRIVGNDTAGANDITLLADGSIHAKVVITSSDRNAKENFDNIDPTEVLAKVAKLLLQTWNYRDDDHKVKHIGPMAQDFQAAFNVGADDKHIATVDADGVALAAIQGLYHMVLEKDALLRAQGDEISRLKAADNSTRAQLAAMKDSVELLLSRTGQSTLAAFKP